MTNTLKKLEALASLYEEEKKAVEAKQALIASLLSPEVKQAIAEVEEEFNGRLTAIAALIAGIETEVKAETVQAGATIKGNGITVTYNRGRVTWEAELMEAYLAKHPNSPIAKAKKQGKPYASLNR